MSTPTLVFVLVWVALALGVLLVAMSGGIGGARGRLQSDSRRSRKLGLGAFAVALVVLGIGVPAAVIAAVESRNSIPEADIAELTADDRRGRQLFARRCGSCHTLEAAGSTAQVGPSLDQLRPTRELVLDAIEQGRSRGNGQMPSDLYGGDEAEAVAGFVAKAVGQTEQQE